MTALDPRQSVEFEPVVLGGRRRRLDPAVLLVLLVVVGLTVAIVKPWGGPSSDPNALAAAARPSADPLASTPPTGNDRQVPADPLASGPTLAWEDVASVIKPRNVWGISSILRAPGRSSTGARTTFTERWTQIRDNADGSSGAVLDVVDPPVVALGISYPAGRAPLDVRIWRRSSTGALYWLDARSIDRVPAQGGLIFVPPPTDPAPIWTAGEYRFDLLLGDGDIRSVDVAIPDRDESIRPSSIGPPIVTEIVPASQVDPSTVPVGPFATIDRIGYPLEGVGGPPLDEAGAWLDTEPGSGRIAANRVSVATLPRATGLGIRLTDGSHIRAASIQRLAPGPMRNPPTPVGGGVIDRRDSDPWVVFAARRGDAWAPGVYRIDVTWSDDAGLHEASWHIELRPGPFTGPPALLAVTRAWARHAGGAGIVVGRAEPLEGGPRSSAIRLLPTGVRTPCGGTVVDGAPEAFGLAFPPGHPLRVIRVSLNGTDARERELATVQAADVVPGLTLIAPTDGPSFGPGIYRLGVADGPLQRTLTLCVGGAGAVGE